MHKSPNMKISVHCILACLYFLLLPTTIAVNSGGNSILKLSTVPIGLYFLITIVVSKKNTAAQYYSFVAVFLYPFDHHYIVC